MCCHISILHYRHLFPSALLHVQVYESCEALFCALADETQKYSDWLALGDTGEPHCTAYSSLSTSVAELLARDTACVWIGKQN